MTGPISREQLEDAAAMFKALSDPTRLRTLIVLAYGERNVGELSGIGRERPRRA